MLSKSINIFFKVLLFLLYYIVLTPIGLLLRVCGKDYLSREFDANTPSFWIKRI